MSGDSHRLDWVDAGRGLAICLVVLFHATNWVATTGADMSGWTAANAVMSSLRMPLFFVLSGLFAAKWLTAPWPTLVRSKVFLFTWVLGVWTIIGMIIQQAGLAAAGQPIGWTSAVRNTLLTFIEPQFELWFIWALAIFFVAAKVLRRVPPAVQLVLAAALSVLAFFAWDSVTDGWANAAKYFFFFLLGLYLRRWILRAASLPLWAAAPVLGLWFAVAWSVNAFALRQLPGVYVGTCLLGIAAGIALARLLERVAPLRVLGKRTLPIYLAHTPVIVLVTIALLLIPGGTAFAGWAAPVLPVLAGAVAVVAALALERAARRAPWRYLLEPPVALTRLVRD